jgi:hypothetical protein
MGEIKDFVLGLPELHRQHNSVNAAGIVAATLTNFEVDKDSVGYFVLNNASDNETTVANLADLYSFEAPERRLRCCCHIFNFRAQVIICGAPTTSAVGDIDLSFRSTTTNTILQCHKPSDTNTYPINRHTNLYHVENMWVQSRLVEGRLVVLAVHGCTAPL